MSKFRERSKISLLLVYVLHKTWNSAFSCHSHAVTAKKYTKKHDAIKPIKPIVFLTFSLRSHRWILKSLICEGTIIHLLYLSLYGDSLRKQPTFGDTTTGFPAKWHLRNERWNSILMMRHYPDLGSAFDWFAHRWGGHILGWIKFPTRHDQSEALPRSE